jgi:hypothetical protein
MYIIINKTTNTHIEYKGSWPGDMLEALLDVGDDVIVISLYSNTIKVPKCVLNGYQDYWEWVDYNLPVNHLVDRFG